MTIAEVGRKYNVSADTLRYYEKIGIIPAVKRTSGGLRDYDEESCKWIDLMKCLRLAGVQVTALAEYTRLFREGDATLQARKNLLIEQRELLAQKAAELQESLERLTYKIEYYDTVLCKK